MYQLAYVLTIPPPERLRLSANAGYYKMTVAAVWRDFEGTPFNQLMLRLCSTRSISVDCWKTPILNFPSDKTIDMFIRGKDSEI
jgi:hypothetical protein